MAVTRIPFPSLLVRVTSSHPRDCHCPEDEGNVSVLLTLLFPSAYQTGRLTVGIIFPSGHDRTRKDSHILLPIQMHYPDEAIPAILLVADISLVQIHRSITYNL